MERMAEYVAAGIIEDIIGSDLCIDIHSSNIFVNEMPQVRINDDTQEKLLPYAKMMNAQFVWIYSSITVLDATLAYSLNHHWCAYSCYGDGCWKQNYAKVLQGYC